MFWGVFAYFFEIYGLPTVDNVFGSRFSCGSNPRKREIKVLYTLRVFTTKIYKRRGFEPVKILSLL